MEERISQCREQSNKMIDCQETIYNILYSANDDNADDIATQLIKIAPSYNIQVLVVDALMKMIEIRLSQFELFFNIYLKFENKYRHPFLVIPQVTMALFERGLVDRRKVITDYKVNQLLRNHVFQNKTYKAITNSIKNDNVEELKAAIETYQVSKNRKFVVVIGQAPIAFTMLDNAALYGSLKCFEYLLDLNKATEITGRCAVIGGNRQIIEKTDCSNALITAVYAHRNDLYDYLITKYPNSPKPTIQDIIKAKNFQMYNRNRPSKDESLAKIAYKAQNPYVMLALMDYSTITPSRKYYNRFEQLIAFDCLDAIKLWSAINLPINLNNDTLRGYHSNLMFTDLIAASGDKELLKLFAEILAPSATKFLLAVKYRNFDYLDALCKVASPNTGNDLTTVQLASQCGDAEMVSYLVANGANPKILSGEDATTLFFMASSGSMDLVRRGIEEYKLEPNPRIPFLQKQSCNAPIYGAIASGNVEMVRYLASFAPPEKDSDGVNRNLFPEDVRLENPSPLVRAIIAGEEVALEVLKLYGKVTDNNVIEYQPLDVAAAFGELEVCKRLVEMGAPVTRNPGEMTPLHYAAYSGSLEVVEFLLEKGADAGAVNNQTGLTTLNAASCGLAEDPRAIIDLLIKKGVRPTPFDLACFARREDFDGVRWLVEEEGVDPNADVRSNGDMFRPVKAAIAAENERIALYLIEHGGLTGGHGGVGEAILLGLDSVSEKLIELEPAQDASSMSAAILAGNIDAVAKIAERSTDLESGFASLTPLKAALLAGRVDVCKRLLELGAWFEGQVPPKENFIATGRVSELFALRCTMTVSADPGCAAFLHSVEDTLFQPMDIVLSRRIEGLVDIEGRRERFPLRTERAFPNGHRIGEKDGGASYFECVPPGDFLDEVNKYCTKNQHYYMYQSPDIDCNELEGLSIALGDVSSQITFRPLTYGGVPVLVSH